MKTNVFNLNFYSGEKAQLYNELISVSRNLQKLTVATPNADFVVRAHKDEQFNAILKQMDYLIADGQPIVWANRLSRNPASLSRITGSTLTYELTKKALQNGLKVAFVGGEEGVADLAKQNIYNELKDDRTGELFTYYPPFGFDKSSKQTELLVTFINEVEPHLLFIGVGSPKQERWLIENKKFLKFGVFFGVGASFDFIAGTKARAPSYVQRLGLEWLWRAFQEPRRLLKRYLSIIPPFLKLFFREIFKKYE